MSDILSLNNISRSYFIRDGVINVFSSIDLNIKKGEKIALMGPSGSGKTSILNIAGLIERPSSGQVMINNINVEWDSDKKISELRKKKYRLCFSVQQSFVRFYYT